MRKWSDICAYRCVIHITGWEVERFLNICKHNDILFTDVIMDKTGVFATISYKAWKTVQKLQEKCQVSCSIVTETEACIHFYESIRSGWRLLSV